MGEENLFNPFEQMIFTKDTCFLCGELLCDDVTLEHVIPKWLQKKYNLWNQKVTLLNGTLLPYRQLTIPCCKVCNGTYLSQVENTIRAAVELGFEEFIKLDELTIFQWITKIWYGLLYRELSLFVDQKNPNMGKITTPELLEQFRMLHFFLRSVRYPTEFKDFIPWSIFIVQTHSYEDKRGFDYHDGIQNMTFAIRLGDIGVIACLQDNGTHKEFQSNYFDKFRGKLLHPMQFDELSAKVYYSALKFNRTPKYIMTFGSDGKRIVMAMPLGGLSGLPLFDEWDQKEYAFVLAHKWKRYEVSFEDVFYEPDQVMTVLYNGDGTVKEVDKDTYFDVKRRISNE